MVHNVRQITYGYIDYELKSHEKYKFHPEKMVRNFPAFDCNKFN